MTAFILLARKLQFRVEFPCVTQTNGRAEVSLFFLICTSVFRGPWNAPAFTHYILTESLPFAFGSVISKHYCTKCDKRNKKKAFVYLAILKQSSLKCQGQ